MDWAHDLLLNIKVMLPCLSLEQPMMVDAQSTNLVELVDKQNPENKEWLGSK